jgi:hypothetical protein
MWLRLVEPGTWCLGEFFSVDRLGEVVVHAGREAAIGVAVHDGPLAVHEDGGVGVLL